MSSPTGCSTRPASPCSRDRRSARHGVDNLRITYANSRENLALALERMRDFLDRL